MRGGIGKRRRGGIVLGRTCSRLLFQGSGTCAPADRSRARAGCQSRDRVAAKRLVRGYAGDHEEAIRSLERAMRLNPLDPRVFLTQSAMAFAHFIAGRDQEASDWAAMAARVKPNWMPALRVAIAANAMLGRTAEARNGVQAYGRVDPDVNIRKICEHYPFQREQDKQRLIEALRRAGVREA